MQKKIVLSLFAMMILLAMNSGAVHAGGDDCFFSKSLHKTAEGMRYWYEAEDGFMALTGIPYNELGCKKCHVKGCTDCHLKKTEKGSSFSLETARNQETCFKCHGREKATGMMDKNREFEDVHSKAGLSCVDCHTQREIHGDGNFYKTMRDSNAKDAACTNCHTKDSEDYPVIPDTKSHKVHKGKLDCNACHVQNTMTCYNCHFGEFARTHDKPGSFIGKIKDFLLLVKYKGKITSGNLQTLVSAEDKAFIVYAPFLTHSIMSEGRKCEECHKTKAVKELAAGKKFTMATFKNGETNFYKGVVPLVPDLLEWPFFRKEDGKWVTFKPKEKPLVQMGLYAEPFTQSELNKLKRKHTYKK